MQTASCPGCGAPTEFKSLASVMAVCGYCRTTVYKEGVQAQDIGQVSQVLDDYSPIQIGTSGSFEGHAFTVVGRIQLKYEGGLWNEWALQVGDGQEQWWLSDASGLYTVTRQRPAPAGLPGFGQLKPLDHVEIDGVAFAVGDVRSAECTGGQGELPLALRAGWQARVADLHAGEAFVTLDYSDGQTPVLYQGKSVTLDALQCQLLRDDETVRAASYRYRGKLGALDCPSCGAAIRFLPNQTAHLVCQSCHSRIELTGARAEVVAAGKAFDRVLLTLEMGAKATISGASFEIIGAMRRTDGEEEWTEYLLHNERRGFQWLVETSSGWSAATVSEVWPDCRSLDQVVLGKRKLARQYEYEARVTYAVGAFNWKVAVGDVVRVIEYGQGLQTLTAEITAQEATWSQGREVSADQVAAWMGKPVGAGAGKGAEGNKGMMLVAHVLAVIYLVLNCIPIFVGDHVWAGLVALALIYVPAYKMDGNDFS